MRAYEVAYIDGRDLKYKVFCTTAENERMAEMNMRTAYSKQGDFDHQIIGIYERMSTLIDAEAILSYYETAITPVYGISKPANELIQFILDMIEEENA